MKRRHFIKSSALATVAAAPVLAGPKPITKKRFEWKMVTAWPENFPGAGTGAQRLAQRIGEMSNGRLTVKVYAAGELVPAFEVFDAVSQGTAEMGHAASFFWAGKLRAAQFFSSVPFGMTANELNAWIYHGGGQALWNELYAPFNLLPMLAGNAGVQMAGWFRREIRSLNDLKGMKMRIQGIAAEVLSRSGVIPVAMPPGEIFTSLQSGLIDAAEFTGPWNDLALGLYKVAKYYYYPGWHEPGTPGECTINKPAFERLPADLQAVVTSACQAMNADMYAEYTANSYPALQALVDERQVQLRRFPDEVLRTLWEQSADVRADIGSRDAATKKVYLAYEKFLRQVAGWTGLSEHAYLKART